MVVLALLLAVAYAVRARIIERRKIRVTLDRLNEAASFARSGKDWTVSHEKGCKVVFRLPHDGPFFVFSPKHAAIFGYGEFLVDQWGARVIYSEPGPVHRLGWDLYSPGPNGVDESGDGDDLLVGEDTPPPRR